MTIEGNRPKRSKWTIKAMETVVLAALPATLSQVTAKTGLPEKYAYMTLQRLLRQGKAQWSQDYKNPVYVTPEKVPGVPTTADERERDRARETFVIDKIMTRNESATRLVEVPHRPVPTDPFLSTRDEK